jgi:hypothetical protein
MRTHLTALAAALLTSALSPAALAQYNATAAASRPMRRVSVPVRAADGQVSWHDEYRAPAADRYGNAEGNQYDLAIDGAFEGQTVAVLHLYTGEGFDFSLPRGALREKGFSVYRWSNAPPPIAEFRAGLARANQLWIVSNSSRMLSEAHLDAIRAFFDAGHGVYVWGDNEPYYADANAVADRLFHADMRGNLQGNEVVSLRQGARGPGLLADHLLSTGIEHLYEGITIATIQPNDALAPLLYGSAGNLVSAYYDHDGKRAIVDGGFTRLFLHWDTAGTARYVKNAAAWLANAERFGSAVVAHGVPQTLGPRANTPAPVAPVTTREGGPHARLDAPAPTPWSRRLGLGALTGLFLLGLAYARDAKE